jgi:hydroxyethylthiazole kinase-like uncharacterized protein yjeF
MEKYLSIAEMLSVEREANEKGLSYAIMMENAGTNLAFWINREYHHCNPRSVLALVGSGNNGGDALVALCRLIDLGWHTVAVIVRERAEDDPLIQRYSRMGGSIFVMKENDPDSFLSGLFQRISVLIDGVLGTGARLPLPSDTAHILGYAQRLLLDNQRKIHVVALDCPSGVNCDNGEAAAETIAAGVTYTMAGIKHGLLRFPAASLVGTLRVGSIGELAALTAWTNITRGVLTDEDVFPYLPQRSRDAHKGSFGTALIVAGSGNYPGAMLLAGEAAYRIGCGLVTIAIPELIFSAVAGIFREATWVRLPHTNGWIDKDAVNAISANLPKASAFLIGPGLGIDPVTCAFVKKLIQKPLPTSVIDADALKLIARIPKWDSIISSMTVLTPHPGEMAVMTGLPKEEIQINRVEIAEAYASKWNKVVVLKGAYTVVSEPNGRSMIVPVATPALARAGTGDVLAGLIVGLLAQGLDPFRAAYMGAYIHALAGLKAEEYLGNSASVLASDVLKMIPGVISKH